MKTRVNPGYALFMAGVVLFASLTTPLKVTCPLDKGTGVITGTMGIEVQGIEGKLINHRTFEMACSTIWDEFTYEVSVSLVNKTKSPGFGTVMLKFYEPAAIGRTYSSLEEYIQAQSTVAESVEEIMVGAETGTGGTLVEPIRSQRASKLLFFNIPAETTKTIQDTIIVWGWEWTEESHVLTASFVNQTKCPYCQGTGKLTVLEWLKIKAGVY